MSIDKLFKAAQPAVEIRGVHLDLKGCPPTPKRLIGLLDVFAAARYNAVLVEWEDSFPWTVDTRFRSETAYTPAQVEAFHAAAKERGIQIIPLVQCLGHMETPLNLPDYAHMREVEHRSGGLNPLAPGARELVENMVDDVLALTPGLTYFHLGGDEAWSLGTHPDTKAFIEKHGKGALYLHHVEPILDKLNSRGVRPILWHDMMREWEPEALRKLSKKADLLVWGYGGVPGRDGDSHMGREVIERFGQHGVPLWGGTAYKGASGNDADRPNLAMHQENALGWANVAKKHEMKGVIATAWSRYNTNAFQCEPIDACMDSMLNVGVILHDAQPPEGGIDACVAALGSIGEGERFEACKTAMEHLAEIRRNGWGAVMNLRQVVVKITVDPRRRLNHMAHVGGLIDTVKRADEIAGEMRSAFAGLMDHIWIERYLAERIEPLREELMLLEPRLRQLDPHGYVVLQRIMAEE